jgi:acetyltransferase-like isoleucine patch superfamily enzyme
MNTRQKENRNRRLMQVIFKSAIFSFPLTFKLRLWAYRKTFGLGGGVRIMEGVEFLRKHGKEGSLSVGRNVLFSRRVSVDYTGGIIIDDDVALSEGAILMSHAHDPLNLKSKKIELTPLRIAEGAWLCVNTMIMPGVGYIGKHSIVSPGSVVYKEVPDYAVVRGNPAEVVAVVPPKARGWKDAAESN